MDRLLAVQTACFIIAGSIATLVLCGWLVPALGSALPDGWSLMKANTALGMLLSIAGLFLIHPGQNARRILIGQICAVIILLLAGTALLGHLSGQAFRLDTLLAADSGAKMPGRMSVQTALFLAMMGFTLLLKRKPHQPWVHIADGLSFALILMVLLILAGYSFNAAGLFGQSPAIRTSPQTLACMALLVVALAIRRTRSGHFALLVGTGVGSRLARTILPFMLAFPFLLIGGSAYSIVGGWLSAPYATALAASTTSALFLVLTMLMARRINVATATLVEAEQQNRLLLNSVGEGIYGLDLDGTASFVNPAACNMLGYAAEEILGQPMHTLMHHHYPDGSVYPVEKCPMYAALRDEQVHQVDDEVFWRKDGSSFSVEYTCTPILKNGEQIGTVVVFADISERRKTEKMKDEFISTVSHELRTPLTSIKGSLGLIVGKQFGDLPEMAMKMASTALENSNLLELLVNDLLDINKIQMAKAFDTHPIHINALVSLALIANQGYADKYGIQFHWQPSPHDDVCILGNESRLMQVLSNLLSNAIKYSSKDAPVVITANHDSNMARISVADSGPGIPLDFQPRVFEKFTQADSSDTRQKGGTGLGLAITKIIVEKQGGRIGFDSTPGRGTTFYFELPIVKSAGLN